MWCRKSKKIPSKKLVCVGFFMMTGTGNRPALLQSFHLQNHAICPAERPNPPLYENDEAENLACACAMARHAARTSLGSLQTELQLHASQQE